jgi:glutaredoxin
MTFRRTRCPHCKAKLDAGQRIHVECIEPWANEQQAKREREEAKKARMAAKVERATTRARKQALKRIPDLIAEAQMVFNKFIRTRDAEKPCICCGVPLGFQSEGAYRGGEYDCGHYRSTGSASHLRFHEDNAHAQRKACNRWGAGRAVDYRIGLVARIGLARVEALESDNTPHKWTREELIAIKAKYVQKLKDLKKETA